MTYLVSFFAKYRDSATMAMIPLCMIVHSQVAVLLPVGEARAMHLCILKTNGQKNAHTPFKSLQTSMSHKIELDLGSAIIRSAKSTKSNNIPDPNPMPIKDGLRPDLMRDRKRRSKTKNGVFRSGFFDQQKKAILCDRILAISVQHFSI